MRVPLSIHVIDPHINVVSVRIWLRAQTDSLSVRAVTNATNRSVLASRRAESDASTVSQVHALHAHGISLYLLLLN